MWKQFCSVLLVVGCSSSDPGGTPMPDAAPPMPDAAPPSPDGHVPPACQARHLNPAFPWYGDNRSKLDAMIDALGCASPTYDPAHKPVAVFDWDNTVVKNDVGDATVFWLIRNGKILQPPNQDWKQTSRWMTDAGAAALQAACGTTVAAGQPLPTDTDTTCADAIFNAYDSGSAFAGHDYRKMEPAYAWAAQLMAGYTLDEQRAFAAQAITENLSAAIGATQTVGNHRPERLREDLRSAARSHRQAVGQRLRRVDRLGVAADGGRARGGHGRPRGRSCGRHPLAGRWKRQGQLSPRRLRRRRRWR
jgi:hypothetical protein